MWITSVIRGWAASAALVAVDALRLVQDRHDLFRRGADVVARGRNRSLTEEHRALREIADDRHCCTALHGDRVSLLRVLGPAHVWALGVGIVLVGEYHRLEFLGRQGRHARRPDRLLGGRPALHVGGDDRFRSHLDGGGRRRPICPGQAHRRTADGLQRGALPGLCLHDAGGVRRHPGRRPDRHRRPMPRGCTDTASWSFTIVRARLAQLSRRADDAQRQLRHHRARLSSPSSSCSSRCSRGARARCCKLGELVTPENALPYGWIGVIAAFQFGIWYYLGIEGTTQAAEEVRSPARSLPYGTMAGMITLLIAAALTWYVCAEPAAVGISRLHLLPAL